MILLTESPPDFVVLMEILNSRHVLFLVGMHRSGTSALSAALHACGATFGSDLLGPMERVNDRGFWESAEVVALNERLLASIGSSWYSVTPDHLHIDWTNRRFDSERRDAEVILRRGFGSGSLEVVKDPRFCITLPFWLALCRNMSLHTSVCVMTRAPVEVCQSLQERDGFPVGYGLRLWRTYLQGIAVSVPPNAIYASYERLLGDPVDMLRELEKLIPIVVEEEKLTTAILLEMKHQNASQSECTIELLDCRNIDFDALDAQIEKCYPIDSLVTEMTNEMVYRGRELTRVGESHSRALQIIDERDTDIKRLSEELTHALSVIAKRDAESANLNQRLQYIGNMHTQALATVSERDRQLKQFDHRLHEIGDLHTKALMVIEERDEQQKEFSQRLDEIGSMHTKALRVIEEKDSKMIELERIAIEFERLNGELISKLKENDAQLQRMFQKPGVGLLFRAMWKYETC